MCSIINFKQYGSIPALNQAFGDRWVYIGRANSTIGLAQSPLANPFKVKDFGGRGRRYPIIAVGCGNAFRLAMKPFWTRSERSMNLLYLFAGASRDPATVMW